MLAIVGGKGGCGKTTTALGLARGFADAGDRPLVVDADLDMPNLHAVAETGRAPGLGAVADGEPPGRVARGIADFPGVEVLPAGRATDTLSPVTLDRLRRVRGRVIVDCPAGATEAVTTPVRAADAAIVISTPDRPSRVDAAKTAEMVRALETPLLGAVLTRTGTEPASVRDGDGPLERACDVLLTVPEVDERDRRVVENPVVRSAYDRLAHRLRERNI